MPAESSQRSQPLSLVTGATGFVGAAVARHLLDNGHRVRVLRRADTDLRNLDGLDVEHAIGDLLDHDSLRAAVADCDYLFHVAADYRLWVPDPQRMHAINVDGTRALMQAALDAGVKRIVYTSTVAAIGLHADGTPSDEDTPVNPKDLIGAYKQTKYAAQQQVKSMINAQQLPAVIVHPSTPVGPGDLKPTPTGRLIVEAARGKVPAFVDTGLNVVHVNDVAAGHLLALEHGQPGRQYILGSENLTLRELLTRLAGLLERKPPAVRLPANLVLPLAYISEAWARLVTNRAPLMTVTGVKLARKPMFFDSRRAMEELGYRPRPANDALHDALEWYQQHRYF